MQLRRHWLKTLAAAGWLGPAGIAGVVSEALAMAKVPVAPGIYKLRGQVTVNAQAARQGQLVGPGDTVATGPDSEVIYVIGQDAYLQRDQSTLIFSADAAKSLLRIATGKVLAVFGKSAINREVLTSTATVGIRGTGFYIEDEGSGPTARTYFCLCYGSVELTPLAAPQQGENYSTSHHEKPVYISNNAAAPKLITPAPMVDHTDAELTLLEGLVGRWPPFAGKSRSRY